MRVFVATMAIFGLGAIFGFGAADKPTNRSPKWEYAVMGLTSDFDADFKAMNSLGNDGWELVEVHVARAMFKRPRP